jgi:hypothetical protein
MAEPVLSPGQYSIGPPGGPAYVYGFGTYALVSNTATDTGSITTQDQSVVGHDGLLFGVDTMAGMVVTQTGQAYAAGNGLTALDTYAALAGKWNDPSVRLANGAVQVLRAWYPGSVVIRRCYGRGRKIMPAYGQVFAGLVPFVAQFQASDGIWYSDSLSAITLTIASGSSAGINWPVTPPFNWTAQVTNQQGTVANTGSQPTWPVITFSGPITNPGISYVNTPVTIGYAGTLRAGQSLVIDTRPWNRTVLLNGANAAGAISGAPMIGMQIQPGATTVRLTGQDATGTATCVIAWRCATLSIGGTTT